MVWAGLGTGWFSDGSSFSSEVNLHARGLVQPLEKEGAARTMTVSLLKPAADAFEETAEIVALVSPKTMSSVHFLLAGKVEGCGVKVGDVVAAGAALCTLDSSIAKLERERARAAVANSARALDSDFLSQQKRLFEGGVIGQGDYERVRIEAEKAASLRDDARTGLALAEKKWELHTLRAPFRGRVVEVRARAGLPIGPEVPAVVLSALDGLVLKAEVPARHWEHVDLGSQFVLESVAAQKVNPKSLPYKEGEPRFSVVRKAPAVSVEKQTFEVELAALTPVSIALAPGMLVSGKLILARHEFSRTLPLEAFVSWKSDTKEGEVFRKDPLTRRARLVRVRTTSPSKGRVHVIEGLGSLDEIVSPVPPHLTDGDLLEGVK